MSLFFKRCKFISGSLKYLNSIYAFLDNSTNYYISCFNYKCSLYLRFKQNLTVPNKDLVKRPTEQYKKIYTSLKKEEENKDNMKNELKNYLKQLTKKKDKNQKKILSRREVFSHLLILQISKSI